MNPCALLQAWFHPLQSVLILCIPSFEKNTQCRGTTYAAIYLIDLDGLCCSWWWTHKTKPWDKAA